MRRSKREHVGLKSLVIKPMMILDVIHVSDKQVRYHVNLPFSCIVDNKDQHCAYKSTLIDIGIGGFSTRLPVFFTVGEKREFCLQLPLKKG